MTDPLKVLFVCTANICRSAYAHVRAESLLGDASVVVTSAGTWGFDASPMDAEMAAQAVARGTDPSAFRSQRITPALVRDADLILTMAREHRAFILEDWPGAVKRTYTLGQFAAALDAVDPTLRGAELIPAVRATRVAASEATDVKDPYRRGTEAAQACAATIDAALQKVLPRLQG